MRTSNPSQHIDFKELEYFQFEAQNLTENDQFQIVSKKFITTLLITLNQETVILMNKFGFSILILLLTTCMIARASYI
jgi:hypothetical protein